MVLEKIAIMEAEDQMHCNFDTVMRMDDTVVVIRPDIRGHYACKALLEQAGAVEGKVRSDNPNIAPNGSVKGGAPSQLRAYDKSEDGSFSMAHKLKTGKYDLVKYMDGMLIEAAFDPLTGKWESDAAIEY